MDIKEYLKGNTYPGRGVMLGLSCDGKNAVAAYFIMGRSESSRNRIFMADNEGGIRTRAFDESMVTDPSLIIYAPVRVLGDATIVTNGDQTDTIFDFMLSGRTFESALRTRTFEPDPPIFTPRISGVMSMRGGNYSYKLSVIKSVGGKGEAAQRAFYEFNEPVSGIAHLIHTYKCNGNPPESFGSDPVVIDVGNDIDELTENIWEALDEDNRVSLFVRYIPLSVGVKSQTRIINRNKKPGFENGGLPMQELQLKYGCNPNQKPARIFMEKGDLPVRVLCGKPGYINFMDALNGWQLVKELKEATGLPAATSFKHVSPAGAAIGLPLDDKLRQIYFCEKAKLSPLACAYARARGADRMSSFGDFISLSDECDESTARLISREVSDGVIAPGYTPQALEILGRKRGGSYNIIQIDPNYVPAPIERKQVFGVTFEQGRNDVKITKEMFKNIPTKAKMIPDSARNDLIIALIALKYTQSNSVCYAMGGQVIGVGAGQQSRIHCTRLAGNKADFWFLRQHKKVRGLKFKKGLSRPDKDNAIDLYISENQHEVLEEGVWQTLFTEKPDKFPLEERREWLKGMTGVSLASDAYFPFGDNIERAHESGVAYIAQPGGSVRDDNVIEVCDKYGIAMAFTGARLFHH